MRTIVTIATLLASVIVAHAQTTTINRVGSSTFIYRPDGRTVTCTTVGNQTFCN